MKILMRILVMIAITVSSAWAYSQEVGNYLSISDLKGYQQLIKPYGKRWTDFDLATVESQFDEYIEKTATQKNMSVEQLRYWLQDCKFSIENTDWLDYKNGENGDSVTQALRNKNVPWVMFEQRDLYGRHFELPKKFEVLGNKQYFKEWKEDFTPWFNNLNQRFAEYLAQDHIRVGGHGGTVNKVSTSAPKEIVEDVKRYLEKIFRIPRVNIEVNPVTWVREEDHSSIQFGNGWRFDKLTYALANEYRYSKVKLIGCVYKKPVVPKKNTSTSSTGQPQPNIAQLEAQDANRNLNTQLEEDQVSSESEVAQKSVPAQKKKNIEPPTEPEQPSVPLFTRRNKTEKTTLVQQEGEAPQKSEFTKPLIKAFQELHEQKAPLNADLLVDQNRMDELKKLAQQEAQAKFEVLLSKRKGLKEKPKLYKTKLDQDKPFEKRVIPLSLYLEPEDIEVINKILREDSRYKDFVNCRAYVHKDGSSWIECLTPRFVTFYFDPLGNKKRSKFVRLNQLGAPKIQMDHCKDLVASIEYKRHRSKRTKIKSLVKHKRAWEFESDTQIDQIKLFGDIEGYVLDAYTKKPIANARVKISSAVGEIVAETDSTGYYKISHIDLGSAGQYGDGSKDPKYDPNSIRLKYRIERVQKQIPLYLDPKRVTVVGKLTPTRDLKYPAPLTRVTVNVPGVDGEKFSGQADEDGNFRIENVPVSLDQIEWEAKEKRGYVPGSKPVELNVPEQPAKVDQIGNVEIDPIPTVIRGVVTDYKGRPVPNSTVSYDAKVSSPTDKTNASGTYYFEDVPADGSLKINAQPEGDQLGARTKQVEGIHSWQRNKVEAIRLFPKTFHVRGRAIDAKTNAILSGIAVQIKNGDETLQATTGADGTFDFFIQENKGIDEEKISFTDQNGYYVDESIDVISFVVENNSSNYPVQYMMPKNLVLQKIVFIVNWNDLQWDLDSQIYTPDQFHLFYKSISENKVHRTGAELDRDNTSNNGQEMIILPLKKGKTYQQGKYRYLLYQYQYNGVSFDGGQVRVKCYMDGKLLATYTPTSGSSGRVWYVGDVVTPANGKAQFNFVNAYPAAEKFDDVALLNDRIKANEQKIDELEKLKQQSIPVIQQAKDDRAAALKRMTQIQKAMSQTEGKTQELRSKIAGIATKLNNPAPASGKKRDYEDSPEYLKKQKAIFEAQLAKLTDPAQSVYPIQQANIAKETQAIAALDQKIQELENIPEKIARLQSDIKAIQEKIVQIEAEITKAIWEYQ